MMMKRQRVSQVSVSVSVSGLVRCSCRSQDDSHSCSLPLARDSVELGCPVAHVSRPVIGCAGAGVYPLTRRLLRVSDAATTVELESNQALGIPEPFLEYELLEGVQSAEHVKGRQKPQGPPAGLLAPAWSSD